MPPTLLEMRNAIVARLVCKAPRQTLGRTALMKLMYFLQELKEVPLGYDFRLYTYGPFDSEVLSDLGTATNLNTVVEKTVIYPRGYGYEITGGKHAERLSDELQLNNAKLAEQIDAVVEEFGSFGAAELELQSTIVFVDREFVCGGSPALVSAVVERIQQIKPHFDEKTILDRVTGMQRKGWLRSFA